MPRSQWKREKERKHKEKKTDDCDNTPVVLGCD